MATIGLCEGEGYAPLTTPSYHHMSVAPIMLQGGSLCNLLGEMAPLLVWVRVCWGHDEGLLQGVWG